MKRPEDKLESLYQERLRDREHPVKERVWERVRDRVGDGGGRRRRFLWWSLSLLLVLILGTVAWSSLYEGDSGKVEEEARIAKGSDGDDRSTAPAKGKARGSEEEDPGGKQESSKEQGKRKDGASAEGSQWDAKGQKEPEVRDEERASSSEEKQEAEKIGEKKSGDPSQKRSRSTDEQKKLAEERPEPEGGKKEVEEEEDGQESSSSGSSSSVGEKDLDPGTGSPNENEDPGKGKVSKEKKGESSSSSGGAKTGQEEESDAKEEDEGAQASSDRGEEMEEVDEKEASGTGEKRSEGKVEASLDAETGKEEKETPKRRKTLPRMARKIPEAEPVEEKELPPMGKSPEKIELSKGSQAIESFYVRGVGSYGWSYRSLKGLRGQELADHRNDNETSINSFSYGIESGVRWSNGFGAGLGLERNLFGSDFSYSGSEVLRDSSFSTDTNKTYIDSTWYDYDSLGNPIDTNTVIIDSNTTYDRDTSVSERDSSYEHEHSIRYRYVTIPISFSYRFEIGERFTLVPTAGFGLNFLTRANAGWVGPESKERISYSYPSDPPFKRFVLSFRGRLAIRYELAKNWRIGAGFRYSRFLQSIYTDEMRIDERPYHYGGSFSLTYLLGN